MNFAATDRTEKMIGTIAGVFAVSAVICVCSILFGVKLLPETKGKTLEEIASSWRKA